MNKLKDLNKLNFSELKKELDVLENQKKKVQQKDNSPWLLEENYFIRTVTMALMGKLVDITEKELILESASWIADTGRFATFLKDGEVDEVEPFPEGQVIVGRGALIDATVWKHDLITKQK